MPVVVVAQPGATVYTIATHAGYLDKNVKKVYLGVPTPPIDPKLVQLSGLVEKFAAGQLPKLSVVQVCCQASCCLNHRCSLIATLATQFARSDSLVGGPGVRRCNCTKSNCSNCTCSKAGAKCHSGCACAKHNKCCNQDGNIHAWQGARQ